MNGGAAVGGTLVNCTITGNISSGASGYGGAVYGATLTNCVVWGNLQRTSYPYTNYASCTLAYCCTDPLAPGLGNIALDPQLLADGVHVASTSPCLGAGAGSVLVGTDIDGQSWNNPPAIGCDEWQPAPVIALQPSCQVNPAMRRLSFTAAAAGQAPFSYFWSKDGAPLQDDDHYANSATPSLSVNNFGPEHAGAYQVVVSNAFGVVTSQVAQVVIHAVDAASMNPAAPYSSWATAAVTIQDAINASVAGDIVLVTNGVYANGGKVMAGDLINRVALNKALTVMSVNGPGATVIQGAWDAASTNGPGAVRCAWMTNGAVLHGFTLAQGATRASGDWGLMQSGGGAWGCSASAVVSGCVLSNNNAAYYGGGMSGGTLRNSYVCANQAGFGGGVYSAVLNNCTVMYNYVQHSGYGGGTCSCLMTNCIVMNNFTPVAVGYYSLDNNASWSGYSSQGAYTCTYPLISGPGNLNGNLYNPAFLGTFHIAATSPCRGAGNPLYASGADLDGESWANPPSMGCDEIVPANQVGPLSVTMPVLQTNVLVNRWAGFGGAIVGRATRVEWSYGDGTIATNLGVSASHQWAAPGDYIVTFTAFNTDNPGGVSTNVLVHVTNPRSPQLLSPMVVSNQFAFQFQGEQQANYTVQYTTDLIPPVAWQTLQSFTYSLGQVYQISDPAVTNGTRFYRVLAQ